MNIPNDQLTWFRQYFQLFKSMAPEHMLKWGYTTGEPTPMASSLESCLAFYEQVANKDAVILNAGAGASSWVLRKLFKNVICTDPDVEYLGVVRQICFKGGLSTDGFIPDIGDIAICDYCYYDYGNIQRMPYLPTAMNKTKVMLYADDTDTRPECKQYRDYIYSFAAMNGLSIADCMQACDEYGRWGVMLTRVNR